MPGFYCFSSPTPIVELTMRQKVVNLTDQQRTDILAAYTLNVPAEHIYSKLIIDLNIIKYVYSTIDAIQERAKQYMLGKVIVTPEVLDVNGVVITPAVMNTIPSVQLNLATSLRNEFKNDFPQAFVTTVISEMMKWSKYDGTGTFTFYKSQVIL